MSLLDSNECTLVGIDFQEKLVGMLSDKAPAEKFQKLFKACGILNIPRILTEQYPKGLGTTVFETENASVFEKTSFSALQCEEFRDKLAQTGRKTVIIGGIETHICVHQTVFELIEAGYEVYVVKDACASRKEFEFNEGIDAMRANGAKITCLEIVLFELLRTSKHPNFKEIQALIK